MKFLNVYCERRGTNVYINLSKIVLISIIDRNGEMVSLIEGEGLAEPIEVLKPAEELIRMINGEEKTAIGFRAGR